MNDTAQYAKEIALKTLRGEYDLLLACTDLARVRLQLPGVREDVVDIFVAVASEVDDLPLGSARQYWAPDALRLKDREAEDYRELIGSQVKTALQELLLSLAEGSKTPDAPERSGD